MRRRYPSDVSECRWKLIQKLIAEPIRSGRKRKTDLREVVNALHYRWTTGCPWRMLPHDFPAWETVYVYYDRWRKDGRLRQIREILLRRSLYQPLPAESIEHIESYGSQKFRPKTDSPQSERLVRSA